MRIGAITSPSVGGASPSLVFFDKSSPHGFCENLRTVGEIFPCRMPTFHIPTFSHFTYNIPHPNIQHSTFSTLLPPIYTFFSSRPAPRPNTPFSAYLCNLLSFSRLSSECHRSTFPTRPSPPRNAIFRLSIPALSKLHPLPFASRSLSYRNSKYAQRRVLRSVSSVQTDLFRPIRPAMPAISPKNPTQVFHQKSLEC